MSIYTGAQHHESHSRCHHHWGGVHGASPASPPGPTRPQTPRPGEKFIAAGATGRSSGLVRMHYDTELDSRLAWESFHYFRNWKESVGGECGFTRTGFIQLVSPKHEDALKTNVISAPTDRHPSLLITADDVKRLAPTMQTDDFTCAAYDPESGYAMPSDTAAAFMNAARDKGARLIQGCTVTGVTLSGGKVTGVTTDQGHYSAPVVVNCAGAWADTLNKMVGLDLPYTTWRHDTMMVARPGVIGPSHPTVIDFAREMYFRPEGPLTLVGLEDGNPPARIPRHQHRLRPIRLRRTGH
ncbi:MAG: FAD-binding oxidoreductase [Chloroflexi bacterium]|nr:FAD-binding oxidoreductase [Chloroflexota bacterium]